MPEFQLPDGTSINVPENMPPELGKRLRAFVESKKLEVASSKKWDDMSPAEQDLVKNNFTNFVQKSGDQERAWKAKNPGVNYPAPAKKESWEVLDPSTRKALALANKESFAAAYGFDPNELDAPGLETEYQKFVNATKGAQGVAGAYYKGTVAGLGKPITGVVQKAANMLSSAVPGAESLKKYANLSTLRPRWEADVLQGNVQEHPVAGALGEVTGQLPYMAAMGNPGSAIGAAARGAALGFVQPVESNDLLMGTLGNTAYGAAGGGLGDLAVTGGSKGVGALRGAMTGWLPETEAAAQQKIMQSLRLPKENISAANLRPGRASKIAAMQDAANMSKVNEANNVLAGQATNDLVQNANTQFKNAAFGGEDDLIRAASAGDEKAKWLLNNKPSLTGAPSNATRGEASQWDVQLQQWLGEQKYGPAYQKAEALLPTKPLDTSGLLARFDNIISRVKAEGKTARLGKVQKFLEDMRSEIAGSGGKPAVTPTESFSPEAEDFIASAMRFGTPRDKAEQNAIRAGFQKIQSGGQPAITGEPPANTLGDLLARRGRLKKEINYALEGTPDALTGSQDTRYLTEAKKSMSPEIIAGKQAAPEYTQALDEADRLYRQQGGPFKDKAVTQLVGGTNDKVYGSEAMDKILGMPQDKTQALMDILSPKGRAAQKSAVIDNIFSNSLDNTLPSGYQFDREAVLNNIQKMRGQLAGNPDPVMDGLLQGIEESLQMMPTLGVKSKTANVVFHGGLTNKAVGLLAANAKGLLTSDTGKALLLTLNLTRDPAVKSRLLKEVALTLQRGAAAGGAMINENQGNPINAEPVRQ